jgi:hypothetical protein
MGQETLGVVPNRRMAIKGNRAFVVSRPEINS